MVTIYFHYCVVSNLYMLLLLSATAIIAIVKIMLMGFLIVCKHASRWVNFKHLKIISYMFISVLLDIANKHWHRGQIPGSSRNWNFGKGVIVLLDFTLWSHNGIRPFACTCADDCLQAWHWYIGGIFLLMKLNYLQIIKVINQPLLLHLCLGLLWYSLLTSFLFVFVFAHRSRPIDHLSSDLQGHLTYYLY